MESREEYHWWFRGRREIIFSTLKNFIKEPINSILDIGSGTGKNTEQLKKIFNSEVMGLENSDEAINISSKKYNWLKIIKGNFPEDLPDKKFDLITFLDCLEHIPDDIFSLKEANNALNKDGYLFITVPAFQFLWTEHDALAHHIRRYTKKDLENKLISSGFKIVKISYFNFFLFTPIAAIRQLKKFFKIKTNSSDFFNLPPFLNSLLSWFFGLESKFLRFLNFPFGVSLLALAKKENHPESTLN